mmetsp:Transcript_19256/g.41741  ORF Transcript_19256/g.41741 Transcript_19256/m.41741 type:complete len:214 (+) Transcript_19256:866-1507(+)
MFLQQEHQQLWLPLEWVALLVVPIKMCLDFRARLVTLVCSRVLLLPITIRGTNSMEEAIRAIKVAEVFTTPRTITTRPTAEITTAATSSTVETSTALPKPTIAMPSKVLWEVALARTEPKASRAHPSVDTATKANTPTKASREGTTRKEAATITIAAGAEEVITAITIAMEDLPTIRQIIEEEPIKATWEADIRACRQWAEAWRTCQRDLPSP